MMTIEEALAAAEHQYNSGNFANAETLYLRVVESTPSHAEAHLRLGFARQAQGAFIGALKSAKEAHRLNAGEDPVYAQALDILCLRADDNARLLYGENRVLECLELISAILDANPAYGNAKEFLSDIFGGAKQQAFVLLQQGETLTSLATLRLLAMLQPEDEVAPILGRIAEWRLSHPEALDGCDAETAIPAFIRRAHRQMQAAMPRINDSGGHHPVFSRYHLSPAFRGPLFETNFLGARTRNAFDEPYGGPNGDPRHCASGKQGLVEGESHPSPLAEDYVEWIDLLEAIDAAEDAFVMAELGAGYGRWLANAAAAIRRHKSKMHTPFLFCGVEAHPVRFDWMRLNLEDNDIDPRHHVLKRCGVSGTKGALYFPDVSEHYQGNSDMHYGARLYTPEELGRPDAALERFLYMTNGITKTIYDKIETLPIEAVVETDRIIDLMDIDIQGAEALAVPAAMDYLNRRVRKLHIGTHSPVIDALLEKTMRTNGWNAVHLYANDSENDTPFGRFYFGDGVQTWINPRLRRPTTDLL